MQITSILLVVLAIGLVFCIVKRNLIERFVSDMESVLLSDNCPNYMVSDGAKYYLVFNHKEFDGVHNPLAFDSKEEAAIYSKKLGCIRALEPVYLRRVTNHDDPIESYERSCAKQVAKPLFSINDCAFTISAKSDDLGLDTIDPEKYFDQNPAQLASKKAKALLANDPGNMTGVDKYKLLRQITDFLNTKGTDTMVNYDIETCMIDKYSKSGTMDMRVASGETMQKFNKYFNTKASALSGAQNFNKASMQQIGELDEQSLSEFNKYFTDANELAIPEHMVKRIFGVEEKI
jgi:hypothetical protein